MKTLEEKLKTYTIKTTEEKQPKETKVYIIDCSQTDFDFRTAEREGNEEQIIKEAIKNETVYSLQQFQDLSNDEELYLDNSFILIR